VINLNSFTDPAGNSASLARVRFFEVAVTDGTTGHTVAIYSGASNGWAFLPPVAHPNTAQPNGGNFVMHDPQSTGAGQGYVVSGTSCMVEIDPGANDVQVSILIAGCSTP
jgi:hypothetical protein